MTVLNVSNTVIDLWRSTHIGEIGRSIGNNLYGINMTQVPTPVPANKETYGMTFFVRPQLNLQTDNIRNVRKFYPLLSDNPTSIHRFVRATLDPRIMGGYRMGTDETIQLTCPLIDNKQAFIPVLSNNITTISGWPDIVVPIYTSDPGLYKEVWSMVDGPVEHYGSFDVDVTLRNTRGDPVLYMMYVWALYMSYVLDGTLMPYPDYIVENEIDYNTRIYRLVLDADRKTVTKIAATGVSIPAAVPTGVFFDFNSSQPFNDQTKEFTLRFASLGFQVFDDILVKEFNDTVEIFNLYMREKFRDTYMIEVPNALLPYFNHRGYPRIDPKTNQLTWYVEKTLFKQKTAGIINANLIDYSTSVVLEKGVKL